MKNLIAAFFMLLVCTVANAQDTTEIQSPIMPPNSEQEITREKIQTQDLPELVKETLKTPDFFGWIIDAAYKARVTDPQSPESEGIQIYIVDLTSKDEKKSIRFDSDGKRLDDIDNK